MRAGDLNRRVRIERQLESRSPDGGLQWTLQAHVWADVRFLSGRALIAADAQFPLVKASVRVRCRSDLFAGMRVVVDGVTLRIEAIVPDVKGREYLDLVCTNDVR